MSIGKFSNYSKLNTKGSILSFNQVHETNLFCFKVEISLMNILYGIADCLQNGLEHSNFYDRFISNKFSTEQSSMFESSITYKNEFWADFSESLINLQTIMLFNYYRIKYYKSSFIDNLLHNRLFIDSLEYGLQNLSINLLEPSFSYDALLTITSKGFEMSLYIQIVFFEIFECNSEPFHKVFTDDLGKNKL